MKIPKSTKSQLRLSIILTLVLVFLSGRFAEANASSTLPREHLRAGQVISFAGKMDASTFPTQLKINPGQKNQEILFLNGINITQTLHFDQMPVVVEGKLIHSKPQWTLEMRTLRSATPAEITDVVVKTKFPLTQ